MWQRLTEMVLVGAGGKPPQSRGGSALNNNTSPRHRLHGNVSRTKKTKSQITSMVILALMSVVVIETLLLVVVWQSPLSTTTTAATTASSVRRDRQKLIPGVVNLLTHADRIDPIPSEAGHSELKDRHFLRRSHRDVPPTSAALRGGDLIQTAAKARDLDPAAQPTGAIVSKARDVRDDRAEYPYLLAGVGESYDIATNFVVLGGSRYTEYGSGESPYHISAETLQRSDVVALTRRLHVKKAMRSAWDHYVQYAFGMDELKPQSGLGSNPWGGLGITLVDALDTLWLMDMKDEFWKARDWVRDHLNHADAGLVSLFETTIRDLGGLLSAYDWSGDQVFLDKATDLGERLLRGFDGSPSGLPFGGVSLKDGFSANAGWTGGNSILAEFGSIQLEFRYLAKLTGRPELALKTDRVFEILHAISPDNGLFPYFYQNKPGIGEGAMPIPANNMLTFGAMSDSFYEYMLKLWLQSGKTEPMYREMYDEAMDGLHRELLQKSVPSGLTYIAEKNNGTLDLKMDHLVCFMGGLLALGAYTDPQGLDSERAVRDLRTAKALTYTCYQMYARMITGISAERVRFVDGQDFEIDKTASYYLLRPEAIESMFILNQLTGDPVYREWGWEIFQAIEKYCKAKYGYGALSNVQDPNGPPRDSMESFFLAETLKYSYLLQDPHTEIDLLRKHVFNTEAHPLRIFPELMKTTKKDIHFE